MSESISGAEADELERALREAQAEARRLRVAAMAQEDDIQQTLGKALRYPWYKDDQKNFPGATEADGVFVGEHVAASLASEAAAEIARLRSEVGAQMERMGLARRALLDTGFFDPEEVGCDIAPRIGELHLALRPQWTAEPPAEPGWYWWREDGVEPAIFHVLDANPDHAGWLRVEGDEVGKEYFVDTIGQWAGPLKPPPLPTDPWDTSERVN